MVTHVPAFTEFEYLAPTTVKEACTLLVPCHKDGQRWDQVGAKSIIEERQFDELLKKRVEL